MGLLDVTNNYTPKENQEFGAKKKLIGDAVCEVKLEVIIAKKSGKKWYILRGEAINCIPDSKGRETTVLPGDEIVRMYDPDDNESLEELADDLFTAGISYAKGGSEDEQFALIKESVDGKLVYFRTWAKDKPKDKQEEGKPLYWQNIKVLSVNKLTPDNSTPQVAF